jgi:uncharacterized membrane protein YcaP (DUF421 family)
MYAAILALLRVLAKRNRGSLSLQDVLLVILIADASQSGMAGDYRSVPEGIFLCGTIVFWSYVLDWLSLRSDLARRLLEPPPVALVRNGRIQHRNLRREMMSQDELMSNLRIHGIEDVNAIKVAFLEPDGEISVIRKQPAGEKDDPPKKNVIR